MNRNPAVPLIALSLLLAACGPSGPRSEGEVPAAPSNVVATPGPGYVTVTWQDESDDEEGFVIYRETATGSALSAAALESIGEAPVDAETFIDRSVEPGVEYTYAVAAAGAQGSSPSVAAATSATIEPGIDLSVGTSNIAPVFAEAQTAYAFYYFLPPAELPTDPVTMSIVGPAGWNGNTAYEFDIPPARFAAGWSWAITYTPAVAGTYTATATINGTAYSAAASTDASNVLGVAQNTSVTRHGSDAAAFEWNAVDGAGSYGVTVYDAPLRVGSNAFGSAFTTATELVVDGLALPVAEYYAGVFAFPIDRTMNRPLKPAEFNVSLAITDTFAVGAAGCTDPDPIADTNLVTAIRGDLALASSPSCVDLLELTSLTANDHGITDLSGLEYAVNLLSADLSGNGVTDLTALRANDGLGDGDVIDLRGNPVDLSEGSDAMADIDALEVRRVTVLHDGLVEIDGLWSTTLTATASTCGQVPVGTVVTGDVTFETNLHEVTATSETGAVSTGTRSRNTVTLTRSDVAPGGETYEVESITEWQEDSFAGESVYTVETGCVITWDFTGSRITDE